MTRDEITDRARRLVCETLDGATPDFAAEKVTSEARFIEDLGADSLDFIELLMAAEEEFDIEIPDDDAEALKSFGQAVEYLVEKTQVAA